MAYSGAGFHYEDVTSALNPVVVRANHGYVCKGASLVIFKLPAEPYGSRQGDFEIISDTAQFQITNPDGGIIVGGQQSTTALTGSVSSNHLGDRAQFEYLGQSTYPTFGTTFQLVAPQGTLTFV